MKSLGHILAGKKGNFLDFSRVHVGEKNSSIYWMTFKEGRVDHFQVDLLHLPFLASTLIENRVREIFEFLDNNFQHLKLT